MRIAIVQFPGSNCERETMLAVKRAGMEPIPCLWNTSREVLEGMDGYILVGGFSYEDRLRAGIIAALHPVMQVICEQSETGKPVLGICNGAQILVETGLVPGFQGYPLCMALTDNKRVQQGKVLGTGFYNAWVHLTPPKAAGANAFNRFLNAENPICVPTAHAQGRFFMPEAVREHLWQEGLIVLQYCDADGQIQSNFPVNPNASMDNIAAVSNHAGNVLAIMPHPERTAQGDALFQSMRDYIAETYPPAAPAPQWPYAPPTIPSYHAAPAADCLYIDLIINDNQAFTVQNTLQHQEMDVQITRQTYWEVQCASKSVLHQVQASGVLYNTQKECLTACPQKAGQRSFLVKAKEDMLGMQKLQALRCHFDITGVESISHGVLWHIHAAPCRLDAIVEKIMASGMLFNPLSHECYAYV